MEFGVAEPAVGAAGRHVGIDADGIDLDVGNPVRAGRRQADGIHHVGAVFGGGAGIPVQGVLQRDDLAAFLHAHFDAGHHAQALRRVHELLLPRPVQPDGTALHRDRQHRADDLHRNARLAAEAAADIGRDDADVLVRQTERLERHRHHPALGERRLRRCPQREASGQIEQPRHRMGLQRTVGVARHRVGVFQNEIRLPESLLDIAFPGLAPVGDVGARARKEPRHAPVLPRSGWISSASCAGPRPGSIPPAGARSPPGSGGRRAARLRASRQ